MVSGHGGAGMAVGLSDLRVSSNLHDSVIPPTPGQQPPHSCHS